MITIDSDWGQRETWVVIKRMGTRFTSTHYLAAFDLKYNENNEIVSAPQVQRIHKQMWLRTLWVALAVTSLCLLLGYPVSFLLSTLPVRISNLLMICVLLPFWTSLLVRLTSWIVLLQKQGVLNDIFVWAGFVADEQRVRMVYNMTGTLVAMTHILLPFMVLPLYSVMKTISPYYVKAARSLGANPFRAFRQIYLPLTIPGIGAGGLLVFILAIGYYITPALVGGASGQLIGNFIALHMSKTLNWGLAAAMGAILLAGVLVIYWLYNRIVGIENMKLG
jgi:putative spermidine/putrescine transport system permease protein